MFSAKQAIAVVTMAVHSLPMVLLRPMGMKLAGSVWSPYLYSMMVLEVSQQAGVSPRIHIFSGQMLDACLVCGSFHH